MTAPVVEATELRKYFPAGGGLFRRSDAVKAVDGVSLSIAPGETLCLVGESGCGKSTVGRLILRLIEPTGGRILLRGADVTHLGPAAMRPHRRHAQMVFQDPYASLNPRLPAGVIVGEPLENYGELGASARRAKVAALLDRVGLRRGIGGEIRLRVFRRPASAPWHRPRAGARSRPDRGGRGGLRARRFGAGAGPEPAERPAGRARHRLSVHLARPGVVEHIGHRVAVMYLGRIAEIGAKSAVFDRPLHPYTEALIAAAPVPDPRARRNRLVLEGDIPSPSNPPPGCRFHTRCPLAFARCSAEEPLLREVEPGRLVACHLR